MSTPTPAVIDEGTPIPEVAEETTGNNAAVEGQDTNEVGDEAGSDSEAPRSPAPKVPLAKQVAKAMTDGEALPTPVIKKSPSEAMMAEVEAAEALVAEGEALRLRVMGDRATLTPRTGTKGKGKGKQKPPPGPTPNEAMLLSEIRAQKRLIKEYKNVCNLLRNQNNTLSAEVEARDLETIQVTSFLKHESDVKDDKLLQLNKDADQVREQFAREKELSDMMWKEKVEDLERMLAERDETVRLLQADVDDIREFKEMKAKMVNDYAELEAELEGTRVENAELLANMEAKYYEEKARLTKEHETELAELKERLEADRLSGLDSAAQTIMADNARLAEELHFQITSSAEATEVSTKLEKENVELKRLAKLNAERLNNFAVVGSRQTKEVNSLKDKVRDLERALAKVVRDFEKEREAMHVQSEDLIDEGNMEIAGLRKLLKSKNRELRHLKSLAKGVLDQRSEVERFLLEALEQVKKDIAERVRTERRRQDATYKAQMKEAATGRALYPYIKGSTAHGKAARDEMNAKLPSSATGTNTASGSSAVTLHDLSLEDRERVLRVLFAKVNNADQAAKRRRQQDSVVPSPGLSMSAASPSFGHEFYAG